MKILELLQGSDEWLAYRKTVDFTSSDAAAALDCCKNTTRNEMIHAKATGESKEVDRFTQKLFNEGHEAENAMRPIIEELYGCQFFPVCGEAEIDGLKLMASLDGLSYDDETFDADIIYEHKIWNKELVASVSEGIVPLTHAPQLEHLLKTSGARMVVFVVSDGTVDNMVRCEYQSHAGLFKDIVKAYKQAKIDIASYTPEPKKEVVIANEQKDLPALKCSVEGSMVVSNLAEYIPVIKELANEQMAVVLDTDQDFADKEAFNKKVKEARATLKASAADIESKFTSLADFNGYVKEADSILQKLQSHGEKQVKESKEQKKASIKIKAISMIVDHSDKINKALGFPYLGTPKADLDSVIKGKRSFESIQNAIDSEIAAQKIAINAKADLIRENLSTLKELGGDYRHLFADHATLMLKSNDDLTNLIKSRISDHKAEEAKKIEDQREQIRLEEQEKAKSEVEANAKEEAEKQRKKIRAEEKEKAERNAKKSKAPTRTKYVTKVTTPSVKANKLQPEVSKTTPEATQIDALLSEKDNGYNLYLGPRKVGYIENIEGIGDKLTVNFNTEKTYQQNKLAQN